jgi:thioredoxin 1
VDGSGSYPTISADDIGKIIKQSDKYIVTVVFSADWLAACHIWDGYMRELAAELRKKHRFFRINIDAANGAATSFGIKQVPTTYVFRGGDLVEQHTGVMPRRKLYSRLIDLAN